jgi:hypothetical protein
VGCVGFLGGDEFLREVFMGDLLLHPTHWLFKQFSHPCCPECKREILPLTPIDAENLDDGKIMFRHAECVLKPENTEEPIIA